MIVGQWEPSLLVSADAAEIERVTQWFTLESHDGSTPPTLELQAEAIGSPYHINGSSRLAPASLEPDFTTFERNSRREWTNLNPDSVKVLVQTRKGAHIQRRRDVELASSREDWTLQKVSRQLLIARGIGPVILKGELNQLQDEFADPDTKADLAHGICVFSGYDIALRMRQISQELIRPARKDDINKPALGRFVGELALTRGEKFANREPGYDFSLGPADIAARNLTVVETFGDDGRSEQSGS